MTTSLTCHDATTTNVLLHARSGLDGETVNRFFNDFLAQHEDMSEKEKARSFELYHDMMDSFFRKTDTTKHLLTKPNPLRYVARPIMYPELNEMYKKAVASFWPVTNVDVSRDAADWRKLSDDERKFLSHVLAFFAAFDGIVIQNLATRVLDITEISEARLFYSVQIAVEAIHAEMYGVLIDTLIPDQKNKMELFEASKNFPFIRKKQEWATRWMDSKDADLAEILVAFAAVEGIFFSGAFAAIFWIKQRGILPGLIQSNAYISKDEGLHRDFACRLLSQNYVTPPSKKRVLEIITEAVEIEKEFITEALPVRLIGMNCNSMKTYIEYVTDDLLQEMGFEKHYGVKNPFQFMINISLDDKTNFFERKVTDYQKVNVMGNREKDSVLSFDDDDDGDDDDDDDDF